MSYYKLDDGSNHTQIGQAVTGSRARYLPFGGWRTEPTASLTDMGFTSHKANNTGSGDIGLIYMNARFYSPSSGRFISADTIVPSPANPQAFNRYSYTYNNPIRYTDPTGHCVFGLPCPEAVQVVIDATLDFSAGALAQIGYNNSLHLATSLEPKPNETFAMSMGRIAGGIVTTAQGVGEMISGGGMMTGGAAACLTGVGCVVTIPAEVAGGAIVVHGASVASSGILGLVDNISSLISTISAGGSSGSDSPSAEGTTGPQLPPREVVSQNGVTIEHYYRSNDHGDPVHLHVNGRGSPTTVGPQGLPTHGNPPLSPVQQRVVNNNIDLIKKTISQIQRWIRVQE